MSPDQPRVVVIILNTNRCSDTLECLSSVTKSTYRPLDIMVLDNGSTDGSVEAIQADFPGVQLVRLQENQGYAGNNNVGISRALEQNADWIFVLNEDTTMSADCIEQLVSAGERDPGVGVVGPLVYHHSSPKMIQTAGGVMDKNWRSHHLGQNEVDESQFAAPRSVDWISGCAILYRREVLEKLGGYEKGFFYYNEEVELCFRARKAGWKVLCVPDAKLWHKGVQEHYEPSPSITYYNVRNQLLFLKKHEAPWNVKLYNWADYLRMVSSWTIRPKWQSMRPHRDAAIQAMRDYLKGRLGKRS